MIDLIHIINLPRREDRRLSVVNQSMQQGFYTRFWPGIENKKIIVKGREVNQRRCTNIAQAFKQIVSWAKENDLPMVTIGEDDLIFTAPGAWQYYLDNMPAEFDTYLGGIYQATLDGNRIMNGYSGHTLITVHKNFYDFFLSVDENDHLDRRLGNFAFEKNYRVCLPFVVQQNGSYSDNHRKIPNYSGFHSEFKYFGL